MSRELKNLLGGKDQVMRNTSTISNKLNGYRVENNMKLTIYLCACFLVIVSFANNLVCQTTPTNPEMIVAAPNGRKVILKPNGTWEYQKETNLTYDASKIEIKSIEEVSSDLISFVDKPVRVVGALYPRSSYYGLFSDSASTHLAFAVISKNLTVVYIYMERGPKANDIRQKAIENGGRLEGYFDIVLSKRAYEADKNSFNGQLLDYQPLESTSETQSPTDIGNGIFLIAEGKDGGKYYVDDKSISVDEKVVWFTWIVEIGEKITVNNAKGDCSRMAYMTLGGGERYKGSHRQPELFKIGKPTWSIPDKGKVGYMIIDFVCKRSR